MVDEDEDEDDDDEDEEAANENEDDSDEGGAKDKGEGNGNSGSAMDETADSPSKARPLTHPCGSCRYLNLTLCRFCAPLPLPFTGQKAKAQPGQGVASPRVKHRDLTSS